MRLVRYQEVMKAFFIPSNKKQTKKTEIKLQKNA
jgi:hypothetical protein